MQDKAKDLCVYRLNSALETLEATWLWMEQILKDIRML